MPQAGGTHQVAVNLSPCNSRSQLLDVVIALVESGLPPQRLELEITETVILANDTAPWTTLRQLMGLGVSIVLDDFGTGYSSLSYLSVPVDKVKSTSVPPAYG
jgi:EAL domain-containing protein (putative c-di-GMP-specific phosphodiesterase class I)